MSVRWWPPLPGRGNLVMSGCNKMCAQGSRRVKPSPFTRSYFCKFP